MLRHKPFVLDWMAEVAARARAGAPKRLLAFSHYPALDPLGPARDDERALFGETGLARRAPATADRPRRRVAPASASTSAATCT